jgi:hypothetical protein
METPRRKSSCPPPRQAYTIAMAPFAPGSYSLVKVKDTEDGELFIILYVNPQEAERRPGYMWESTKPLTEKQAMNLIDDEVVAVALLEAARNHFKAQR